MIRKKRKLVLTTVILILIAITAFYWQKKTLKNNAGMITINPFIGNVSVTVTTTGIVEPQNRLEIKPAIGGRIEKIMVKEGDGVREGQILAWMSSTERAALIDAARSQGEETLRYWEEVYKKTPIISPINGEVIVRAVEPGQTVTTTDAILVLSNRLVISAQFDETDIGKVKLGRKAIIMLDAYPDVIIDGVVDHIAYESKIVNNVTIYDVDIIPKEVPEILRSGMSVTVEVVEKEKDNVLTIPSGSIHYDGKRQFVLIKDQSGKFAERNVTIGLNDEKTAEVISGLGEGDSIAVPATAYLPKRKNVGTNPFMPFDRKRNDRNK